MNLTPRRYNIRKEPNHIAYDNMLVVGLIMQRFEDDIENNLQWSDDQDSTCMKLIGCKEKRQGWTWLSGHTLSTWVAKNTNWTSPCESLHFSTPKPYKVWLHLNLQGTFANTNDLRGLSAKMHYFHFGKRSNGKSNITMLILGKNYPKLIYGMPYLNLG